MIKALVISKWLEPDPKGETFRAQTRRPLLPEAHPPLSWTDVTGQSAEKMPSKVPIIVLEGEWSDEEFELLKNDPDYAGAILQTEATKEEKPKDFVSTETFLKKYGATNKDVGDSIKYDAEKKEDMVAYLNDWIKKQ